MTVHSHSIYCKKKFCKRSNVIKRVSFVGSRCTGATHFAALEWCGCATAGAAVPLRSETHLHSVWRVERVLRQPLLLIRTRAGGASVSRLTIPEVA